MSVVYFNGDRKFSHPVTVLVGNLQYPHIFFCVKKEMVENPLRSLLPEKWGIMSVAAVC